VTKTLTRRIKFYLDECPSDWQYSDDAEGSAYSLLQEIYASRVDYDRVTLTPPDVYDHFVKMVKAMDHPHQWYGGRTYAQHGDDLAILNIFGCLRIRQPSYLDIGAHHPFELSNTALLYARGSRGVNVEANPALIDAFHRLRPEDKNVCVAVGPQSGSAKLNRVNETSGINSLLPIEGHGAMLDAVDVPVLTIDEIVDIYADGCWPDLLTLDAEGMDLGILRSIDYARNQPKVICAEAVSPAGNIAAELRALMTESGYLVHSWAGSNMLFVRSELRDWLY
jgi:FkbM family methyltransferase